MKIGVNYQSFNHCSGLLYALQDGIVTQISNGVFSIKLDDVEYLFSIEYNDLVGCDKTIILLLQVEAYEHHLNMVRSLNLNNYKFFQVQIIENYHCDDDMILKFLNDGNIILSTASVNFEHENFIFDPFLNLYNLYYQCGYNYLNYHNSANKENLLGTYYRPIHVDGAHRPYRTYLYDQAVDIIKDDFKVYTSLPNTSFSRLLESNSGFGLWGKNYISTYTDYDTSVCNIMFETLNATDVTDPNTGRMYNREYITEKTLQAILYSKQNVFFTWYGPNSMMKMLKEMSFWFLNFEFYNENDSSFFAGPYNIGPTEKSLIKTFEYLRDLKQKYKNNNIVHKHLLDTYSEKLKNNGVLFDKLIKSSRYKKRILELIRK